MTVGQQLTNTTGLEARSNARFKPQDLTPLYCSLRIGKSAAASRVIDISLGGLGLRTQTGHAHLAPGGACAALFKFEGVELELKASIRSLEPGSDSTAIVRVEFDGVSRRQRARLGTLVEKCCPFEKERLELAGLLHPSQRDTASGSDESVRGLSRSSVEWSKYAESYDLMCSANPEYAQNIALFLDWARRAGLAQPTVCDLGAGTGNYIVALHSIVPGARFVHVDRDPVMNLQARKKYRAAGISRVEFVGSGVDEVRFPRNSFDLILCVNALYAFADPLAIIRRTSTWLKPGGYVFAIDLGRLMDVGSWSRFVIRANLRNQGFLRTVRSIYLGRHAITQNRVIRREQEYGAYWLHSTEEFTTAFEAAGLTVDQSGLCYRDYCDLAVARKAE